MPVYKRKVNSISKTGSAQLKGDITLSEGENISLTQSGQDISIASTGGGDVATDSIWDAKGDLVIGTGSDTATRLALGTNGQVLTVNSLATNGLQWSDPMSSLARQAIINGNFDVWQRGTSFTNSSAYGADRWRMGVATDAIVDVLQSSDVPTVAESGILSNYSLQIDVTTADSSIAAAQSEGIYQRVEGYNITWAGFGKSGTRYITLSFWVKSTKTGIFCVSFRNSDSSRSYVAEYTVSSSDTWEKKIITIPVDTTGTWLYTTGIGLNIGFTLACGADAQISADTWTASLGLATSNQVNALDSTDNNFRIAQVQLCAGDVALPFMPKSFEEELRACQRYYEKSYDYATAIGTNTASGLAQIGTSVDTASKAWVMVSFKVNKRSTPVISVWTASGTANQIEYSANGGAYGASANYGVEREVNGQFCLNATGKTPGQTGTLAFQWVASSEL